MNADNEYEAALSGWFPKPADPNEAEASLGAPRNSAEYFQALEQVRGWVRKRFGLSDEAAIMVSEVACNLPGCPPLETVVAFWENEQRHHFKLFKQLREVGFDDLPYAWMKESLIVPEGFGCECC